MESDEEKELDGMCGVAIQKRVKDDHYKSKDVEELSKDDLLHELSKVSKEKLIDGLVSYESKMHALRTKVKLLEREKSDLSHELAKLKTSLYAFDSLLVDMDNLNNSFACLKYENELLKSNAPMSCDSCVVLHH